MTGLYIYQHPFMWKYLPLLQYFQPPSNFFPNLGSHEPIGLYTLGKQGNSFPLFIGLFASF